MRFSIFLITILFTVTTTAQTLDTSGWLRAFPITDYMIDANDSVKIVQVQLPDGLQLKEKAIGVLYGLYRTSKEDAVQKGYGRCQLIKGDYYYFGITRKQNTADIQAGDLIYTRLPVGSAYYGYIVKLASHYIELSTVEDSALYNRYNVFNKWTAQDENKAISRMVADISSTGKYFKENNPAADVLVKGGDRKGQSTFFIMINCTPKLLTDFLNYMLARPRNYAGKEWRIAEIFATWISEGAPTVVK